MRRILLYNSLLIALFLTFGCSRSYWPTSVRSVNFKVNEDLSVIDSQIYIAYLPYKKVLDKEMHQVIGISNQQMVKHRPESMLTNFLGDLLLTEGISYCQLNGLEIIPDLSYYNYGGIRSGLPKGEVTIGNIYEIMPFENELVFVNFNGKELKIFFNTVAGQGGVSLGGVKYKIKDKNVILVEIGGEVFDENKNYWIVTNDYVANGGDGMSMMLLNQGRKDTGIKIRDVIIHFISEKYKRGEPVSGKLDGRVSYE